MASVTMTQPAAHDAETDSGIIRRVLRGDVEAYELLVRRYLRVVQGFVTARFGLTGDNLDEAVQAALVAAYEGLPRLRDPDRFAGYLLKIASRTARQSAQRMLPLETTDPPAPAELADHEDLQAAISRLPPDWQQLLAMKYGEELTADEIARRLGRSVGTITKELSRAYARLRDDTRLKESYET